MSASSHDLKPGNNVFVNPLGMGTILVTFVSTNSKENPHSQGSVSGLWEGQSVCSGSGEAGQSWGMWIRGWEWCWIPQLPLSRQGRQSCTSWPAQPLASSSAAPAVPQPARAPLEEKQMWVQMFLTLEGMWSGEHHEADTWQG